METLADIMSSDKPPFDVALLSETHRPTNRQQIQKCLFFLHGNSPKERKSGVAIALSQAGTDAWKRAGSPDPHTFSSKDGSGRLIGLHLEFTDHADRPVKCYVIAGHLPHSGHPDDVFDECLDELLDMLSALSDTTIPIIGIDANAQIGTRTSKGNQPYKQVVGPHGFPAKNARGRTLLTALSNAGLCSPTTLFQAAEYDTWTSKHEKPMQIDYILIRQSDTKRVTRCQVNESIVSSDHKSVEIELKIIARMRRKLATVAKTRPRQWDQLRNKTIRAKYNATFRHKIAENADADVATVTSDKHSYTQIMEQITATSEAVLDERRVKDKVWFSLAREKLMPLQDARNEAHHEYRSNRKNTDKRDKFYQARRVFKAAIKEAKEVWLQGEVDKLKQLNADPVSAWKAMRTVVAGIKGHWHMPKEIKNMIMPDGKKAKTDKENAQVISKHFKDNVFARESTYSSAAVDQIKQRPFNESLAAQPTFDEFKSIVHRLKDRKAPGPNGIPIEAFKAMDNNNLRMMHKLMLDIWTEKRENPAEWHEIALKLIPKKGNLQLPQNWRPICLIDVLLKVQNAIIA
ncbi:MAG: hypothetical protein ACRDL7_01375, partial [Gaiellaceae bacterium]